MIHVERIAAPIQKNSFKYFFEKVAVIAKLVLGNEIPIRITSDLSHGMREGI